MPLDNRTCFTVNLRDRLSCRNCGAAPASADNYHRGFEYHHIVPKSAGGADEAGNIVLLCHDCHLALHKDGNMPENKWDIATPERFSCGACAATLEISSVEMNCGWYFCPRCRMKTHLWAHCFGDTVKEDDHDE